MLDTEPVHFSSSEDVFEKANTIFQAKKKELQALLPNVDIQHVGSCAVPGAWGKLDVDVQIRAEAAIFGDVVDVLKKNYEEKCPEIWTDEFLLFRDKEDEVLIDLLVTVRGSRYDDFYRVRDALIADPQLLGEYNNLKKQYEGRPYGEYREAKKAFFGGNGKVRFLKY